MDVFASLVSSVKIGQLPVEMFFDWSEIPLSPHAESRQHKRLKGTSEVHLSYFKDADIPYPPKLSNYAIGFVGAICDLPPAAMEVAIFGEETDPWPETPLRFQWADTNMSLKLHIGSNANATVFKDYIPFTLQGGWHVEGVRTTRAFKNVQVLPRRFQSNALTICLQ
jgi:hypothetical protein